MSIDKITAALNSFDYAMAIWTDRADFITDKKLADADKLLEIRCFDASGEFRAYRSTADADFTVREITSDDIHDGYYDEMHYLDIDESRSAGADMVYAIGAGKYHMPVANASKLVVRFYYQFDENSIARKVDWRLVGFEAKEG